jgi:hypothetical protein
MAIQIGSVVAYHVNTGKDRPALVVSINGDTTANLIVYENPDLDRVDAGGSMVGSVLMGFQRSVASGSGLGQFTQISSF